MELRILEGWSLQEFGAFVLPVLVLLFYLSFLNYRSILYWKSKKIPYLPPARLFSKDALESFLLSHAHLKRIYNHSNNDICVGFYQFRTPLLLLKSPHIIYTISNKDFKYFKNKRPPECTEGNKDPLSQHLLALSGYKWTYLRSKLTPSFTPDKLKNMFPILEKCVDNFISEIASSVGNPIEVKDLCGRLSMDCIASCAFGLELNCVKNENRMFIRMSSEPFKAGFWHNLRAHVRTLHPKIFKALKLGAYNKEVQTFFCSIVERLIRLKKESKKPHVDFVYVLLKLLEEDVVKPEGSPFTMEVGDLVAAQVFSFFVGGYETTSITMGNALFELARNEEVKTKLREEIDDVIGFSDITYENVNSLKYLGCVIDEVLRIHPPVYYVQRVCSDDYQMPGTDIIIEKGLELIIPIREIHHDPNYFPEPMKFDPERFNAANKLNIVKGAYIPFGEGPRHCIGFRFSLLELKISLTKLIRDFDFTLDPRTPSSLTFEEYARIYKVKNDILLRFFKRVWN